MKIVVVKKVVYTTILTEIAKSSYGRLFALRLFHL